jgi:hypothetical protein
VLSDLLVGDRRLALVGLAKNTGKTETLAALLRELAERDRRIGVTSIGRDGEARDVIDARIDKPRILLQAGDLVASTAALVRASGLRHERLTRTGVRTPLGEVVIARLTERGTIEVAGPSAAADVREVSDAMLDLGVEQVLIDGAIDRRVASSPAVADGLVMATGAILAADIETVVAITRDAVDLVRLPRANGDGVLLEGRLVLNAEPDVIAAFLREHPHADTFLVQGALGERFLEGLLAARRERAGRELRIIAADPTKVFLYKRQGLVIGVLHTIGLRAITVNPVAPQSHAFDSRALRESIEAAIADVPVLDVRDQSYLALAK